MFTDDVKFIDNKFNQKINKNKTYVLDSNVVMKMRDLFYQPKGKNKMEDNEIEYWIGLVEFFRDKDVIPGIALQELSWDFQERTIDDNKFNRLAFAIESLFSYEDKVFERIRRREHTVGKYECVKKGKRIFNGLSFNEKANEFLLPTYCMLLKFYEIIEKESDRKKIYIELCDFLKNTLKIIGAYELEFINNILFLEDKMKVDYRTKMFKMNDKKLSTIQKIWNCSWDIFYMRVTMSALTINSMNNEAILNIHNPVLVTRDKDLYELANEVELASEYIACVNSIYPGVKLNTNYREDSLNLIEDICLDLNKTREERLLFFQDKDPLEHCKKVIRSLERELGY